MMHIDYWLYDPLTKPDGDIPYAKFVLCYFMYPAWMQSEFKEWMYQHKLFCTYKGKRYRVTGASRMGDIWLAKDKDRDHGYDLRVDIMDCGEWSNSIEYDKEMI